MTHARSRSSLGHAFALLATLCLPFTIACDDSAEKSGGDAKVDEAAKKKADEKKKTDEALAKRKADREAKKQAEKEAEEKKAAAIDAVCILPEKLPKKLDKACAAVAKANDEFMLKMYKDKPDVLEKWNSGKKMQLDMTTANCKKTGSIEIAACQANGLMIAGEGLTGKELPDILRRCSEKFAKKDGDAEGDSKDKKSKKGK
jgi:hypothetical protein